MMTAHEAATLHGRLLIRAEQPTAVGRALRAIFTAHAPETVPGHDTAVCSADLSTYPCATIDTGAAELGVATPTAAAEPSSR